MTEAEPQVVPNILTEHDFQDAFKNDRSARNSAYAWNGTTQRVMVTTGTKVTFSPEGSTVVGTICG
jgi:hypothetical protein